MKMWSFRLAVLLIWTCSRTVEGDVSGLEGTKPCGDFPWDTSDVTVQCDYDWWSGQELFGKCSVFCNRDAEWLVGPPYAVYTLASDGGYYCNKDNRTWLGTEPVCLGQYDNATMVTDETNRIRLVGGEFYGCVEMYDNVTNQWGPLRGWNLWGDHQHEERMAWADVACRSLGFPSVLATHAYTLTDGTVKHQISVTSLSYLHWRPSYSSGLPKFIMKERLPDPEKASLYDAIDRVERGSCKTWDYRCRREFNTMCLACAGQGKHNEFPGINAQVTCTSESILVSFPRPVDNSIQRANVHLAAPPCSAGENSTHIYIQASLTGCGTNRQDTEDDIIYSNTVTINVNASSAIITRYNVIEISVECRLPRRSTVAVNFDPTNLAVYRSHIVGRGEFTISMELYLNSSFQSPVSEYPLSVDLGQMLYVQVQVTSDDKNLQVFVDACMATPTHDPENVLYHLIRDGCERDSTVARYWSPSTMQERFGFQAFAFTSGARKVYLHCDVLLCNATDPSSRCAQGCQAGGRSVREAEGDTDAYLLIQGPIVLNDDRTVRDDGSSSHGESMVPAFIGACAVIIALLIGV
ncbi:CUB and zona pellucida-like domain-containing protein 1 [Branchiostoma floridae]|uniref:CUB and zona pellucida-like domain-containing protein 1 n=1 Tax=Branchiostoma floridae TaxID=7739 RepID=A0A9J7K7I2_BRAFL|nr:CUB and zona pellucida-like domain-containing protein 1 [Branchiostoma floridae]